jgi:type I restriction enzyme, R subunit
MGFLVEQDIEDAALEILQEQGYKIIYGPDIAPDGKNPERESWGEVVLKERLKTAIDKFNSKIPKEAKEEAIKKVLRSTNPKLIVNNEKFHNYLVNGVEVEYRHNGRIKGDIVQLFDFKNPKQNEFLAINQFTIIENKKNRRPDIVLFINGLPLAVIELKNPVDEKATIWSAYNQLQTYKKEISSLFNFNEICVISDGTEARAGTITSNKEWFLPWKSTDGENIVPKTTPQLETLLQGIFDRERFLDIIRNFVIFWKDKKDTTKILAGYHQFFATNKSIKKTLRAVKGNKKIGVIWHTQGSGKSLTLSFYAGKIALEKELSNPTLVVITDRNDLDDQLFNTFASSMHLREKPVQVESVSDLKEKLKRSSGGIIFTTIQKFSTNNTKSIFETLSERSNIIVAADEAHRTQYGFKAKFDQKGDKKYGFAKYLRDALPNASFIGFTGTPIDFEDKNTRAIFGDYIDTYDISQAVNDERTVRIYYESRLANLDLKTSEKPSLDKDFEDITEGEEDFKKQSLKTKWARLEAIVGDPKRIKLIAKDIVKHYEQREETLQGKAMIVGMSRRICVDLYNEIIKIRPSWHNKDDKKGVLKVIMTGSASDSLGWQQHIRNKQKRRALGERFKKSDNDFKIAIVRDMWLTGFDVPSLHTMYMDKPIKGHGLMQAIARVNRVFKDKPGGLIVDYLGIANELKKALTNYAQNGGEGKPTFDQKEAVSVMLEKYEIVSNLFHGFNYSKFFKGTPREKMALIPQALEHILQQKKGKERYLKYVTELSKSFALSIPNKEALKIREDVGFFQAIKAALSKATTPSGKSSEDLESAIKQIVSRAVSTGKVIDIFEAAGLQKPDISILSDEFLEEVKGMKQKNLAFEALKKLLDDEIRVRFKQNKVKSKKFSEMLEAVIRRYQNRSVDSAQIIQELIEIAKEVREAKNKGEELGLTEEEVAFYDALADNKSARDVLGDEILKKIARELAETIQKNVSIDWKLRETVRAKLRVVVKRLLKKYGYPPDKTAIATDLVLEQAEVLSDKWSEK